MPTYETEIIFPYSAKNIYDMVADIEAYPQFLPNCESLIINQIVECNATQNIVAEMEVKYRIFSEKFSSNITLDPAQKKINVNLASGPIKKMQNQWQFLDLPNGCKAHFYIKIEMKNLALRLALAAAFNIGIDEITKAFIKRADRLYNI